MRYVTNFSQMLEETSRTDEGVLGKCLNVMLYKTLADKLWSPFKVICFNPVIILATVSIVYVLFCIIFIPLLILSYLISSYGSFIVFLVVINYLVQVLARAIAFPGCNIAVQKQLSSEFIGRIIAFLENVATVTADFSATIMLVDSGRLPSSELQSTEKRLNEIVAMAAGLPKLQLSLMAALESLTACKSVLPNEEAVLKQLVAALDDYNKSLALLVASPPENFRSSRSVATKSSSSKPSATLTAASQCLKTCEALKIASSAAQPPKSASNDEDSSIVTKLKGLLSFTEGLKGSEKLTFPYMRELLRTRFNAHRFTIAGNSGNTVDAVLIFASAIQAELHQQSRRQQSVHAPTTAAGDASTKGIVLFCSPNAGFYECVSQSDLRTSWLGYYSMLGYDVCYYNYAGYGSSTGVPSPVGIKKDALLVAKYLRREHSPAALILHGESIGGMAACFVARHCTVEGLVCDRTFASLDAVATRLLRGQWAGYGLRYLGLWQTHVVSDYLSSSCPKLILQDPDDDIIANVASLKNGIATHMLLDDNTWYLHSQPQEYLLAAYLNQSTLPHKEDTAGMLSQLIDLQQPLQEAFVAHLFACVLSVAKKAKSLMKNDNGNRRGNAAVVNRNGIQQGKIVDPKSTGKTRLTNALQNTAHTIEMINAQGSINMHGDEEEGCLLANESSSSSSSARDVNGNTDNSSDQSVAEYEEDQLPQFSSQKQFLEYLCSLDISSDSSCGGFTPFTKVWIAIARIDGCTGQLLGQAVRGGYDGFRAWVCALLVWGTAERSFPDNSLPLKRSTVQQASKDLDMLLFTDSSGELRENETVIFLRDALKGLTRRVAAPIRVEQRPQIRIGDAGSGDAVSSGSSTNNRISSSLCSNLDANSFCTNCYEQLPPCSAATLKAGRVYTHCEEGGLSVLATTTSAAPSNENGEVAIGSAAALGTTEQIQLGKVVTLHCGHNGWPSYSELTSITDFFTSNKLA